MSVRSWLKHAFAVDAPGEARPTPEQEPPVDWLARQIARRHLTTPGLIALEMCRPLNWIIAQGMHFSEPAVWAVTPDAFSEHYRHLAAFLERRGSIEHLCRRLEAMESEYSARERGNTPTDVSTPSGSSSLRSSAPASKTEH
jgi:hypothetical protein